MIVGDQRWFGDGGWIGNKRWFGSVFGLEMNVGLMMDVGFVIRSVGVSVSYFFHFFLHYLSLFFSFPLLFSLHSRFLCLFSLPFASFHYFTFHSFLTLAFFVIQFLSISFTYPPFHTSVSHFQTLFLFFLSSLFLFYLNDH